MPDPKPQRPTILILSGGVGASAEQVVHTVLAQFPHNQVEVITIPSLRYPRQIDMALERVQRSDAILVHTLVDEALRAYLLSQADQRGLVAIDLMGELLEKLSALLQQEPLAQPGLYRQLNEEYFDRVAAIEYSMAHDDGQHPEDWSHAEIILLGVSRVGKTPLSMYLSVLGWKVANIPLVADIQAPQAVFELDRNKVVGLKIELAQLLTFRQQRQRRLGVPGHSDYTNPEKIYAELQYAERIYRKGGFTTLQVTNKPIETSADEIIRLITSRIN